MKKDAWLRINRREQGFTLFEYCAGAAVILGVVWAAMTGLGVSMSELITSISSWAKARATEIKPNAS